MPTKKARKNKVAGFLRALEMMNKQGMTQYEACQKAGISRMTFNKYREMFGDQVSGTQIEVLPKEEKTAPVKASTKNKTLEQLSEENAIMAENLRLKQALGLLQ